MFSQTELSKYGSCMTGNALLDLLLIALPLILVRLWWTGSRAHELAIGHAKTACRQQQLQFLDQTVARTGVKLSRDSSGAKCLMREYRFEFTDSGQFRDTATLTMHGHRLGSINFPYLRDEQGNRIYLH